MDLRAYYRKLRETESQMKDPFILVASLETPDGGKAGVITEVARLTAAKQILEGRARVATNKEISDFEAANRDARVAAENASAATKVQVMLVPGQNVQKGAKE